MKSREISRSKIGPFSLACFAPLTFWTWTFRTQDISPPYFLDLDVLTPDILEQDVLPPNILDLDVSHPVRFAPGHFGHFALGRFDH